jgi:acid phosphatase type 7
MNRTRVLIIIVFIVMFQAGCSGLSKTSDLIKPDVSIDSSSGKQLLHTYSGSVSDVPTKVHLSWISDPSTTMTILWQTEDIKTGAVDYGTDQMAEPLRINLDEDSILKTDYGIIHEATLSGLSPGTLYYYRCGSNEGGWSRRYSFRTAPVELPFKFAVLGDTQNFRDIRRKIATMIKAQEPLFIIQCGDMVNLGINNKLWDEWFDDMQDLISGTPLMPVMGNHDNYCMQIHGLCSKMFEQFAMPDNNIPQKKEYWYSLDVAGTHFTMLNSEKEAGIGPDTDQYKWLEEDLERSGKAEWTFAFMHKPPFSMGAHGDDESVKKYWVPIFDNYNVDIVFSGHEHLYERTKPLTGNHPSDTGTVYIVSGSSGSVLYPLIRKFIKAPASLYEAVSSGYCYIIVDVKPGHTEVNVIGLKDKNDKTDKHETIDSFTIQNKSNRLPEADK